MAKKENKPMLTETKILVYAIAHLNAQIEEWEQKFADNDLSDPSIVQLKEEIMKPFITDKALLIQRYELETGVDWQGV